MAFGKVRPYCDCCKLNETLKHQIALSNSLYYILFHGLVACLFLFYYNRNSLLIGNISAIAGFVYFCSWIPFDIAFFYTDLPEQVKLMQSEQFSWIYSIVIFGIAFIMGLIIANKLDNEHLD
jgi:hypothetical protein